MLNVSLAASSFGHSSQQALAAGAMAAGQHLGAAGNPFEIPVVTQHAGRNAEILAQGHSSAHCFQVVEGCVRTVNLMEDGRRQIGEFLLPDDIFGWEAAGESLFAAEAVTPVTLRRFPLSVIEERAANDLDFARQLRRHAAAQVRAAQARFVMLGRKTASERIAGFLIEMTDRLGGASGSPVEFPMSRGDIADHLGLTAETVCRELTELRRCGAVAIDRMRRISIVDRAALGGVVRLH